MITSTHIQKTLYKVSDFLSWQKAGSLVLAPEFQRRSVWKTGAKSYLIDTIVRGLPIPIIFLRDRRTSPDEFEPKREVVDGQQRLRTVIGFVSPDILPDFNPKRDDFRVQRNHNKDIAGKNFKDLDNDSKQAILDYEFVVHVLPARIDDREIIQIFRRMNATNYTLTKQEQRNAKYFGEFKSCVYQLAAEQLQRWRRFKIFTEDDIARMAEVEHTSECVLTIIDRKISGKSAPRIDNGYKKYDVIGSFPQRTEAEKRFRAVMDSIEGYFGMQKADFVFFKKTLIYTFFSFLYDLQFGFKEPLEKRLKPKLLTPDHVSQIKLVSDQIRNRNAPENVLEATDRRTTNPKERGILFEYLQRNVQRDA